jgi:thiamine biosynthesis lipoprotein
MAAQAPAARAVRVEHVMGTVFSLDVRDPACAPEALDHAVALLHDVDRVFSTYREASPVSRLGRGEIRLGDCPPEVAEVLDLCAQASRVSDGYFSATWGARLDPSGLVKGWAIERVHELLRDAGSGAHCICGGGDVRVGGSPPDAPAWGVGIADPRRPGGVVALARLTDAAVATSGPAERGLHVVDPHTGRPATHWASLTVVADTAWRADAYATAGVAMGPRARDWLTGLSGISAWGLDGSGTTWSTPDFPGGAVEVDTGSRDVHPWPAGP